MRNRSAGPPTPRDDVRNSSDAAVPSCAPASPLWPSTSGRKPCDGWPGLEKCPASPPLRLCCASRCGAVRASAVAAAARRGSSQRIARHSGRDFPAGGRQLRVESQFDPTSIVATRLDDRAVTAQAVPSFGAYFSGPFWFLGNPHGSSRGPLGSYGPPQKLWRRCPPVQALPVRLFLASWAIPP